MARKPNPMLAGIEARYQRKLADQISFTLQQCKDVMLIAANQSLGIGPERAKKFADEFDRTWQEYASMCIADAKEDRQIWYTKDKVDAKLQAICGDHFIPWEERYKL